MIFSERITLVTTALLIGLLVYQLLQGTTKRLRPGLVNMRKKNCVLLPAAGMGTQFFHIIFTKPGRSLLVVPCRDCQTFRDHVISSSPWLSLLCGREPHLSYSSADRQDSRSVGYALEPMHACSNVRLLIRSHING